MPILAATTALALLGIGPNLPATAASFTATSGGLVINTNGQGIVLATHDALLHLVLTIGLDGYNAGFVGCASWIRRRGRPVDHH